MLHELRIARIENTENIKLKFEEKNKIFDPKKVYKDEPNPTKL